MNRLTVADQIAANATPATLQLYLNWREALARGDRWSAMQVTMEDVGQLVKLTMRCAKTGAYIFTHVHAN